MGPLREGIQQGITGASGGPMGYRVACGEARRSQHVARDPLRVLNLMAGAVGFPYGVPPLAPTDCDTLSHCETEERMISLTVHGTPAPQGSKVRTRYGMREASALVEPWREAIVSEVMRKGLQDTRLDCPLVFKAVFWHKRLASHYGRKNGRPYLKESAPVYVATTPDLDKVLRSTFDGLTQSGLIADDKLIVIIHAQQRYSMDGFTGVNLELVAAE